MKYLKVALTLMLALAFVANLAFAAGSVTSGRLPVPQKEADQVVKVLKLAPKHATTNQFKPILKESDGSKNFKPRTIESVRNANKTRTLTKGTVPPEIIASGLSGTFHIGAANQFKTLADMAFLLNIANIGGPVEFILDDPSYTENALTIGGSPGASATNTITIHPAAGNTACVITLKDSSGNGGGFVFSGAQYLTIEGTATGQPAGTKNLTILFNGAPQHYWDSPVMIYDGIHVTVSDCVLPGYSLAAAWTGGNASVTILADSGLYNSHVTVNNCEMSGGHYGVLSMGNYVLNYDTYGVQDDNINVTNCYIHDVKENGINLQQVTAAHVTGNTVQNVIVGSAAGASPNLMFTSATTPPSTAGLYLADYPLIYRGSGITVWGDHSVITKNLVDNVNNLRTSTGTWGACSFGIRAIGFGTNDPDDGFGGNFSLAGLTSASMVSNNIITRVFSNAVQANGFYWHEVGIEFFAGRWDTCVYNTVYFSGTETGLANPGSAAAFVTEGAVSTSDQHYAGYGYWLNAAYDGGGGAGGATLLASERTIAINNVFANDRTGGTAVNACIVSQDALSASLSSYAPDYRPPSNHNVLFLGTGVSGYVGWSGYRGTFPSLLDWSTTYIYAVDGLSQVDDPAFMSASNVHINPARPSTADGEGVAYPAITTDFAGTLRGAPPNAGAYEGHGSGPVLDLKTVALMAPTPAGVPAGLPYTGGFKVSFQNLTLSTATAIPFTITIAGPDPTIVLNGTATVPGLGIDTVTLTNVWTPVNAGNFTMTVVIILPGDVNTLNDTVVATIASNAQQTIPYSTGFENPADRTGWFGDNGFALGSVSGSGATQSTKLGGAHGGDKMYVTNPGAHGVGYNAAMSAHLYSPYFNLTGKTSAVLSFYHSLRTEPEWDRSIVEYTLDTGKTWLQLGGLNDTNGINWYSTAVYANAAGSHGTTCFDTAQAKLQKFPDQPVNPATYLPPPPCWTSNGICPSGSADVHTGPDGYIFVQYDLGKLTSHSPLGHSYVRFRYVGFSDYSGTDDGWAIDDFSLNTTAPTLLPDTLDGVVYLDTDGGGTMNGAEAGISGATVQLTYFGTNWATATTDGSGNFRFIVTLPGPYEATSTVAGFYQTQKLSITNNGTGGHLTGQNIGRYQGYFNGTVFSDVNNNGHNNSEPGLAGYVVTLHKGSRTGEVVGTATTIAGGAYSILAPPVKLVAVAVATGGVTPSRSTVDSAVATLTGSSGSAVSTGNDLGFYVFANLKLAALVDINGNGTRDLGELGTLPTGLIAASARVILTKGATTLIDSTIGNGLVKWIDAYVDTGAYTYTLSPSVLQPGWKHTNASTYQYKDTASGQVDTLAFLFYRYGKIGGTFVNDVNGNSANDGEPGLPGWIIQITGEGAQFDTTDATGAYTATGIGPGAHTVSLVGPVTPGSWIVTLGTSYSVTLNSNGNAISKDFGAFLPFTISGSAYRDMNFNGAQDAGEVAVDALFSTVVFHIQYTPFVGSPVTHDVPYVAGGTYSYPGNGPGHYVITATYPADLLKTQPATSWSFDGVSGTAATGKLFGFFKGVDSVKYTTLTPADYIAAYSTKAAKAWKAKAPTTPNVQNLAAAAFTKAGGSIILGTPDKKNAGGKVKGYVKPAKVGDVFATFYSKKTSKGHEAAPHGLDFDQKGGLLLKLLKNLPPDKSDNVLAANLLALELNIQINSGIVPGTALSAAIINDGGPYQGLTVQAFVLQAETTMTLWEFVPQSTFQTMSNLAARINTAFRDTLGVKFDTAAWHAATPSVSVLGYKALYTAPFLKVPTSVVPAMPPVVIANAPLPKEYAMYQNYPNPFNPTTNIDFDLPQASTVTLKIYNMLGQEVATLFDHTDMSAGQQTATFNANNYASGVYLYRIFAQGQDAKVFTSVKKMVLVK